MLNIKENEYFLITGYSSSICKSLFDDFIGNIPSENFIFVGRTEPENFKDSLFIKVDFKDTKSIKNSIIKLQDKKIKYMFLNHGVLIGKSSTKYTFEELLETIHVNITSYLYILSTVGENLIDGGSTVLMSSVSAKNGSFDDIYSASKALVEAFMKSYIYKIGTHRINCVAPGITLNTRMTDIRDDYDNLEKKRIQTPLKKLAQPLNIAKTIIFLLSDDSSHITKTVIPIDGGI
jgi:NAD(P)-dependent dehydrogenase (short-subunit alcohol dehydrogenase family)